jgi:hypothetical protein
MFKGISSTVFWLFLNKSFIVSEIGNYFRHHGDHVKVRGTDQSRHPSLHLHLMTETDPISET